MAEFNSPNFKRVVQTTEQRPLREFTVGAPEPVQNAGAYGQYNVAPQNVQQEYTPEQINEMERMIKEARKEKISSLDKITEAAKKRIELLANIGRLTKDVAFEGVTFSLRTLKAKESKEAALDTFKVSTNLEAGYEARKQQLARAIYKIDGHDVSHVLGSDDLDAKLNFIEELEEHLVSRLFDEFTALKDEARTKFGINTEQDAKEVIEDLKK